MSACRLQWALLDTLHGRVIAEWSQLITEMPVKVAVPSTFNVELNLQNSMNPKAMQLEKKEENCVDFEHAGSTSEGRDMGEILGTHMKVPELSSVNVGGANDEDEKENNDRSVNTFSFTRFVNICKTQTKVPIANVILCANDNCQRKAVPMNAFCVEHIGADKTQCLFQSCKARHTDFSLCDATIVPSVLTYLLDNNQIYDSGQPASDKARCSETTHNDVESTSSASSHSNAMILLCLEHRLKLERANKLKSESSPKTTVLQRAAAKHERKLARIEKRNKKLDQKREKELLRSQKKPRVSATVRVWAKRRRKKQPTVIQTGGKRINNIPYRPYPDYEWRYSSSQSSQSVNYF